MTSEWLIPTLAGAFLIAAGCSRRFRTGTGDRATTSLGRYLVGLAVYAAAPLAFYWLSSYYLHARGWEHSLPWGEWKYILFGLVVVGLPVLPVFRGIDRALRRKSRELAGVQLKVARLSCELAGAELELPDDDAQALQAILKRRGYSNGWLARGGPLTGTWRKISTLRLRLRRWEGSPRFARYMEGSSLLYGGLRNRYDQLSFRLMRSLDVVEQLEQMVDAAGGADAATASLESLVERDVCDSDSRLRNPVSATNRLLFEELRVDVDLLLRDFCTFIARGVLSVGLTASDRSRQFKLLGFQLVEKPRYEILAPAFALFVGTLVAAFKLFGTGGPSAEWLPRALMIATLMVIALCVAILPKRRFAFANRDIRRRLPYAFILAAALAAFVLNIPVRLAFMAAIKLGDADGAWRASWSSLLTDWPFLLLLSTMAAVSAILVQDGIWRRVRSLRKQRLMDGLTLAGALGVMMIPVQHLLRLTGSELQASAQKALLLALVAAILGFVIGVLVPWSFRTVARSGRAHFLRPNSVLGTPTSLGSPPSP